MISTNKKRLPTAVLSSDLNISIQDIKKVSSQKLKDHSREVAVFLYNLYRQRSILKEGQKDD